MNKDYSKYKILMRAIGLPLAIIGIIFIIVGFSNFGGAHSYIIVFATGGFLLVIGFGLLSLSIVRPISKYYISEASPAIKMASNSIGEGLKESGFQVTQEKEVIKIKCPNCGYLESEDADFCSKCGKKI